MIFSVELDDRTISYNGMESMGVVVYLKLESQQYGISEENHDKSLYRYFEQKSNRVPLDTSQMSYCS
jgi:hypothetical protein